MGLDQYLSKRTYVKHWDHKGNDNFDITVMKGGEQVKHIQPKRISYIIEEVMYWRKANQIHQWFVDNVQGGEDDCGEYYVEQSQLKELLDTCEKVKVAFEAKDFEEVENLLPTSSGFFFGSTDYDEWYLQDITDTIEALTNVLAEGNEGSFYYEASW